MKIKMMTRTTYRGTHYMIGKTYDVSEEVGQRWVKNRIAAVADKTKTPELAKPSAKDLYAHCKNLGLEVKSRQTAEYYEKELKEYKDNLTTDEELEELLQEVGDDDADELSVTGE